MVTCDQFHCPAHLVCSHITAWSRLSPSWIRVYRCTRCGSPYVRAYVGRVRDTLRNAVEVIRVRPSHNGDNVDCPILPSNVVYGVDGRQVIRHVNRLCSKCYPDKEG
jgi:hypothetical protein